MKLRDFTLNDSITLSSEFHNMCMRRYILESIQKHDFFHALADVAQWIKHKTMNQRVAGSIPSQGTYLGCRPGPQWGGTTEATTY